MARTTPTTVYPASKTKDTVSPSHHNTLFALEKLPFSIRVLLESAIRNCDEFSVTQEDVEKILNWETSSKNEVEIPFKPGRVLLQDFTLVKLNLITINLVECQLWLILQA